MHATYFVRIVRQRYVTYATTATATSASVPGSGTTLNTRLLPCTARLAGNPSIVPLMFAPRLPLVDPNAIKRVCPAQSRPAA